MLTPRTIRTGLPMLVALLASAGVAAQAPHVPFTRTDERFCPDVQRAMMGATPERNVVHATAGEFRSTKAAIRPLDTRQFALPGDGPGAGPVRVSCKMKSPDYIKEVYGEAAAFDGGTCAAVNRAIVAAVSREIDADPGVRRVIPDALVTFDEDTETFFGPYWLADFAFAYTDDAGRLHFKAKRFRVDRDTVVFAWAPDAWRGNVSCHLVAPEYVRSLLLGTSTAPVD